MLLNFKMCQFLHDFVNRRSSKLLFCYYLRNSVSLRARSGRKLILSTFRPWIVWDVSRTKTNSNKNCSNLITIPVNPNFLLHFFMGNNTIYCNAEKVIYFLLLDRKQRKPSFEDETEVLAHREFVEEQRERLDLIEEKVIGTTMKLQNLIAHIAKKVTFWLARIRECMICNQCKFVIALKALEVF